MRSSHPPRTWSGPVRSRFGPGGPAEQRTQHPSAAEDQGLDPGRHVELRPGNPVAPTRACECWAPTSLQSSHEWPAWRRDIPEPRWIENERPMLDCVVRSGAILAHHRLVLRRTRFSWKELDRDHRGVVSERLRARSTTATSSARCQEGPFDQGQRQHRHLHHPAQAVPPTGEGAAAVGDHPGRRRLLPPWHSGAAMDRRRPVRVRRNIRPSPTLYDPRRTPGSSPDRTPPTGPAAKVRAKTLTSK
jgi:hypothetical protein